MTPQQARRSVGCRIKVLRAKGHKKGSNVGTLLGADEKGRCLVRFDGHRRSERVSASELRTWKAGNQPRRST